MTVEETRAYLKSYRNMLNRVEYIDNKLINVKSIRYDDAPVSNYSEPKTQNDYIMMKDKYLNEMALIRKKIEELDNITYRDVLFYKYVELMNDYDIAELMDYSVSTVRKHVFQAVRKLSATISNENI